MDRGAKGNAEVNRVSTGSKLTAFQCRSSIKTTRKNLEPNSLGGNVLYRLENCIYVNKLGIQLGSNNHCKSSPSNNIVSVLEDVVFLYLEEAISGMMFCYQIAEPIIGWAFRRVDF